MQIKNFWPFKAKQPKPIPDPGTTRRSPTVVVEHKLAPGSDKSIEYYGSLDPHVITVSQLEQELAELDRRIDILVNHRLANMSFELNDQDNYVYQPQLNALLRSRIYKTRELASLSEPTFVRKPMLGYLDDLYLRLFQTQDWIDNKSNTDQPLSQTIQFRVQQLMHELVREIRDLSYDYQPASAVEIVDHSTEEMEKRQQRLSLLLTDQWQDYIKHYKKK